MAMVASAGDAYKALDRSSSPMRLHPATGQAQRPPMNPYLSPLDESARPSSPPFQVASMDEIRDTAKQLAQSRSHSMLPRGLAERNGPHDDPSGLRDPSNVNRSDANAMDEQVPVPVVLTDSATWLLVQKRDSEMMEGLRGEVDLADRNGWTCLHWASLMGKDEHVAIILDSGADWSVETTVAIQHVSGNRRAGTTPEELARYPGGVIKGHVNIVAMLQAAERGGWQQRKMCKQNGDAAVAARDWVLAVHWYEKALGAVLQVEDTPVCKILDPLAEARKEVEREEAERLRLEEQRREEARRREEERRRREEEERLRQQRRHRALLEGKEKLRVGDGRGAIKSAVAAMEGMDDLQDLVLAASRRVINDEVQSMEAILEEKLRMAEEKMAAQVKEAQDAAKEAHHLRVLEAAEYARKLAEETAALKEAKERAERELKAEKARLQEDYRKEKLRLQEEMERYKAEKDREVELARQAQERAEKERDRVNAENERLVAQHKAWLIEREELLKELEELRRLLAEARKRIEELEEMVKEMDRLRGLQAEFDALRAERDALLRRVSELEALLAASLAELERVKAEYKNAVKALQELLQREKDGHAVTREERDTLQQRCNELQQRVLDLEEEIRLQEERHKKELAEKLAALEAAIREELAATLRQMEEERREAEERAMRLQSEIAALRAKTAKTIRDQQSEIIELREKLTQEQLHNEMLRADAKVHEIERQEWMVERERLMEEHRRRVEKLQIKHAADMQELKEQMKILEAKERAAREELLDAQKALAEAEALNERLKKQMQEQLAACAEQIAALTRRMEELQVELESTHRRLQEAQRAIIANKEAMERARREAARLRQLLAERDELIEKLRGELVAAEELRRKQQEEYEAQLAAAAAERKRLEGVIADLRAEMAELRAELDATIKALEEEREAHAAEHLLRLERERELSNARRRIEQLLETIREKDEALRQLTEEAKKAVIRATDFLADAVRKQQEELQGQLVNKMVSVGGEIDQVAASVSRPTTAEGVLIPQQQQRDGPSAAAAQGEGIDESFAAQFAPGGASAQQLADAAAIAADDRPSTAASAVSSDRPGTAPILEEPETESEALAAAEAEVAASAEALAAAEGLLDEAEAEAGIASAMDEQLLQQPPTGEDDPEGDGGGAQE
jgi:hypothetical protein